MHQIYYLHIRRILYSYDCEIGLNQGLDILSNYALHTFSQPIEAKCYIYASVD